MHYLKKRGISIFDIIRYRIGYAETGPYSGKIIIPSYDSEGQLNYFVSRAFYENDSYKHKNPKVSKDIIGFDMLINWNEPIILCEGAFDAITIKRNAIPLFGKQINPKSSDKNYRRRSKRNLYMFRSRCNKKCKTYSTNIYDKKV